MYPGQAGKLFNHLYPDGVGGDYLEIRTLPEKRQLFATGVDQAVDALRRVSYTGNNVHFGLCTRLRQSGKTDSTSSLPAMFVDFDFKDFDLGQAEVESRLAQLEHPPTAVVCSGHGFHCYWRIRNRPVFKGREDRDLAQGALRGFCEHVGGDAAASKITSCPRVPGSGNFKYRDDVRSVEIASLDDDTWYDYEDFTRFFVLDERKDLPTSQRPLGYSLSLPASFYDRLDKFLWLKDLWRGHKEYGDTSRSGMDITMTIKLRKYFDYGHDEIAAILLAYPHGKAKLMPRRYLQDTVNRGVAYADSGH